MKDEFLYEEGLEAFVAYLNEEKDGLHEIISFEGIHNEIEVDFSFQYNDGYSENILSFVNNVRTIDGGTHESGAKTAITRTVNEYARNKQLLKEKAKNLDGNDIREGLTAVISVRIPEDLLQFEGQTKSKLGTPEAKSAMENVLGEKLTFFFEENPEIAQLLIKKAIKAREAREAARKARRCKKW